VNPNPYSYECTSSGLGLELGFTRRTQSLHSWPFVSSLSSCLWPCYCQQNTGHTHNTQTQNSKTPKHSHTHKTHTLNDERQRLSSCYQSRRRRPQDRRRRFAERRPIGRRGVASPDLRPVWVDPCIRQQGDGHRPCRLRRLLLSYVCVCVCVCVCVSWPVFLWTGHNGSRHVRCLHHLVRRAGDRPATLRQALYAGWPTGLPRGRRLRRRSKCFLLCLASCICAQAAYGRAGYE